jgi:hypothetical protein
MEERFLSRDFVWELEKLRRRFGVDGDEFRSAVRELTRKQRGLKPQDYTEEITRSRKNRRASRELEYRRNLEELADSFGGDSQKGKAIVDRLTDLLRGDPMAHAVLCDFADCLRCRVVNSNNILDSDKDHLEQLGFYLRGIESPDAPGRRKLLAAHIKVIGTVLRELRKNT